MGARRYQHDGRVVEAMRFVANGPDVARFAGAFGRSYGEGLSGVLRVGGHIVECGDWVVMDRGIPAVVRQEIFANRFQELRHADVA